MNIYESIKNNLKEAYEVGIDDKKIIASAKEFSNMLENTTDKYINKDVIQAIYKIVNSGQDLDILRDSFADSDGSLKKPLEQYRLSNGETLYLYGPVVIYTEHNTVDIEPTSYVTIGAPQNAMYGVPAYAVDDSWVYFTPDDGSMSLDYIFDNTSEEDKKKIKENLLAMLEKKQDILRAYKYVCKKLADTVLSKANKMGVERRQEVADKQRHVANILNK